MKNKSNADITNAAVSISGSGKISAVIDGKSYTVDKTHKNYGKIIQAIKDREWYQVINLIDLTTPLKEYVDTQVSNRVNINGGAITFDGIAIHNTLTDRILSFMDEGLPFEPLLKFFENLMENPSYRAINSLYGFLEIGELPITEDGFFLAYKNVRSDFKDIHTGIYDNSIGANPKMPRNMVNENPEETCSSGLHVCSLSYLPHFSDVNGHTMIVKVNPKNVVSIPLDYGNTKLRCCEYEVIAECFEDWRKKIANGEKVLDKPLYSSNGDEYGIKPSGQKFYNVRDEKGHFVKKAVEPEIEDDICPCGCQGGCGDSDGYED